MFAPPRSRVVISQQRLEMEKKESEANKSDKEIALETELASYRQGKVSVLYIKEVNALEVSVRCIAPQRFAYLT